ncbi:hypothetical protein [Tardiphaga sp. 839_C3_N1_4]|uniref:hypothetical protein n=1 Tax=Tardiphaga sp. 839_C3_N1_4 TaxID=3240761 RepID=UPI003F27D701
MTQPRVHGGYAAIEGDAVVIRFPLAFMQTAIDGAWGLNVIDKRQKVTDQAEFAKEFCRELNAESENGTTLIHRMADKAFVNMIESGAFGFDDYETAQPSPSVAVNKQSTQGDQS